MPFEIACEREFAAAHQLRLYDGALEPLHGHNWRIRVVVASLELDPIGVVMDFHELERLLDALLAPLHNSSLNALPAFARVNPSAENLAAHVGRLLSLPKGIRLVRVDVWEMRTNRASFIP